MRPGTIWIGTTVKFVEAACPAAPLDSPLSGYGEVIRFENGGFAAAGSFGQGRRFDFNFNVLSPEELAPYKRLRHGSYGSGLIYFPSPAAQRVNLFAPHWAEPGLLEVGDWPAIYDSAPTFGNVAANSYDQPLRKATWSVVNTNTFPTLPAGRFVIPIPPDQTLWLGVSGTATGTAAVRVRRYDIAGGTASEGSLTLLSETGDTRLNASYDGASFDYAEVFFARTSSASSTLTVTSMLAQLWPTGVTPVLTGNHRPGEGQTGCRFVGDVWAETDLVAADGHTLKTAGFSLVEVGAWS